MIEKQSFQNLFSIALTSISANPVSLTSHVQLFVVQKKKKVMLLNSWIRVSAPKADC